jgi:cleavage and polyadenylation specificity factor subunit 6/7
MRLLIEKLGKEELHGQAPVVTYATKQALAQFESQSKTRAPPPSEQQTQQQLPQFQPHYGGPPRMQGPPAGIRGPIMGMPPRGPPPHMIGPPHIRGMPSGPPPYMPNGPPPPIHRPPPQMIITAPPPIMMGVPPRGPPPIMIPTSGSAPYVNPAFFAAQGAPRPSGVSRDLDFEEIMSRNR